MANASESLVQDILSRAHDPDNVSRIYSEKIAHRPLFLRPSSPPPAVNAREARRRVRQLKQLRAKALKPKPLSSRQRRKLGLHDVPKGGQKYEIFEPLNKLWLGYIREILGNEVYTGGQGAAAKLSAADFHGAEVEVSRSGCPSRVGIKGIVIKDSKYTFEIITRKNRIKVIPKEKTMFRVRVPVKEKETTEDTPEVKDEQSTGSEKKEFVFEILGEQFQTRSADRATKKFRAHFMKDL